MFSLCEKLGYYLSNTKVAKKTEVFLGPSHHYLSEFPALIKMLCDALYETFNGVSSPSFSITNGPSNGSWRITLTYRLAVTLILPGMLIIHGYLRSVQAELFHHHLHLPANGVKHQETVHSLTE